MSVLGATLTLPGIAGIVLTVGMAVDANVLIFSRIREELKERAPQAAIQVGFDRALLTILDANITTFFVAIILFSIGSGPVKGFAITLAIGIVTSMFTAILGTRSLVNLMYGGRTAGDVEDMNLPEIDFMGKRRIAAGISVAAGPVSIGSLIAFGLNRGLDFHRRNPGGGWVSRNLLTRSGCVVCSKGRDSRTAWCSTSAQSGTCLIRMPPQLSVDQASMGDDILSTLREVFPGVEMRQSNFVGPAVGEELTEDAGLALLAALVVIMLYILFRFTKQFSVGAVAALVHDVAITLGIFSVMQWTFDLSVLAALLAVIGYSLNDTIVVSDRIRENFRKIRRGTPVEIINRSLNQTLGRTLVTSLTTLFVLLALLIRRWRRYPGFRSGVDHRRGGGNLFVHFRRGECAAVAQHQARGSAHPGKRKSRGSACLELPL